LRYAPDHLSRRVEESVVALLPEALRETAGHLLVFLPGVGEIRRTGKAIRNRGLDRGVEVLELYGDLSPADQDRVVAPSESRKIVLATNVAETSVTIPGVTGVIDSGQARVLRYDPQVGLPRLEVEAISRASADQRSGRAGRTAPGICWRLWPAAVGRSRPQRDDPEIVRGDFSGAALTLISWGERDLDAFPWLTPPRSESVTAATELLERLGAITPDRSLTETGAAMNRLPLHPRLARFLIEAVRRDVAREASLAAALLTERDPFRPSGGNAGDAGGGTVVAMGECDLTERVERLERYREGERPVGVAAAAARNVLRVADRLWHECQRLPAFDESVGGGDRSERLRQCLLRAYPDRLARRRSPRSDRGRMIGGRGVQLRPESFVRRSELFLCIDIGSATGRGDATVRIASAIEPQWLEEDRIREVSEPFFHPTRRAVVKRRRRYVDDLVLDESPVPCEPDEATAALLHAEALRRWDEVFPADDAAVQGFVARVAFLREHAPELALDPLDRGALEQVLRSLCWGCTSLAELRRTAWLEHLKARYDYEQHRLIDREAPPRVTVPSGNTIAVRYAAGKPPVMEVRIQELFGWRETPRVAKGRVAIRLHLLGPNGRPQQITDDLENFWNRTYHEVRKELRGRYPKHHWPEDPLEAQATRNGLKPKPAK
jgi:ATP-dependent helicase HrpB